MKHTKHTPGPWTVDRDIYGRAVYIQQSDTKANGGWVVATVWGEDKEANGCLIAAAPDLLAALQDIEASLSFNVKCSGISPFTEQTLHALRKVRAAIAKATGQV